MTFLPPPPANPQEPSRLAQRKAFGRKLSVGTHPFRVSEKMDRNFRGKWLTELRTHSLFMSSALLLADPVGLSHFPLPNSRLPQAEQSGCPSFLSLSEQVWRAQLSMSPRHPTGVLGNLAAARWLCLPGASAYVCRKDAYRARRSVPTFVVTDSGTRNTAGVSWQDVSRRASYDAAERLIPNVPPSSTADTGFPPNEALCRYPGDLLGALADGRLGRQGPCCR